MQNTTQHSSPYHSSLRSHLARIDHDDDGGFGTMGDFSVNREDRVGHLPRSRRWRKVLGFILLLGFVGGGTMAALDERAQPYLQQAQALAQDVIGYLTKAPEPKIETAKEPAKPMPELASRSVGDVKDVGEAVEAKPATSPETQQASLDGDDEKLDPLPPPAVDQTDQLQVKAAAAGLHPGISRVLLEKLSAEDFRNAALAIRTALVETPELGTYIFPSKPAGGLAQFQVKFVRGAGPPCRRYVVAILKDAWVTTALPMEDCEARKVTSR